MIDHIPMPRPAGSRRTHDRAIRATCQECALGCGLIAYIHQGRLVDLHGDEAHPVSRGRVCAKGLAFIQGLDHPERLRRTAYRPTLEEGFHDIKNWDRALSILAGELGRLREQYGPESLVIGCDPEAGLDFYLGAIRFARLFGTPHVHHPLDPGHDASSPRALNIPDRPCYDWVKSGCLFLVEADLASTHPVAFQWVLEAQKAGTRIIAADARFTATMARADRSFYIAPASGNDLGLALLKHLLESGAVAADFAENWLADPDALGKSLNRLSIPDLEAATLASSQTIDTLARLLIGHGPVTMITGKRLSFLPNHQVWPVMSLWAGWTPGGGCGWYPLESGQPPLDSGADLAREIRSHGAGLRDFSYQYAREAEPRTISPVKAVISTGNCLNDFLVSYRPQLDKVELAAYYGSFPNFTWSWSHLVFPAAMWPERDSLFFTQDRAVCFNRALADPPADCLSGLDFWIGLARKMGWEEHFPWGPPHGRAEAVLFYRWIMEQSPWLKSGRWKEIEQSVFKAKPVFWPFGDNVRQDAGFPMEARLAVSPFLAPTGPDRDLAADYPLHYQATRLATRSGDASSWWPWTSDLEDDATVQIHPDLAAALGLENGDEVVVRGPKNSMTGKVWLNRMTPRWLVWSPHRLGDRRVLLYKKRTEASVARQNLERFLQ